MAKNEYLKFNDGIAKIYCVNNSAAEGERPAEKLAIKRKTRFENRTVGMQRYFDAMQNQIRLAKLILIPDFPALDVLDVIILSDGETQYRIEQIQRRTDTKPYTMQLSLSAVEQGQEMEVLENDDSGV